MHNRAKDIHYDLLTIANQSISESIRKFFKTNIGEYAEHDKFLGIKVPILRNFAKKYINISVDEIKILLHSDFHEERYLAILLLINTFRKSDLNNQKKIYFFYLKNLQYINNWDLVDISASNIIGEFLKWRDKSALYKLSKSSNIWARRIAIISTFTFIKNNDFIDALQIGKIFLYDKHDLIHKATGWMLREIGKRDEEILLKFLKENYKFMPRVMLRYAIEKITVHLRKEFLQGS